MRLQVKISQWIIRTGTRSAVTDAEGVYCYVGIEPGTYAVKADLSGFLAQQVEGIAVGLSRVVDMNFTLRVGGVAETVEVSASALAPHVPHDRRLGHGLPRRNSFRSLPSRLSPLPLPHPPVPFVPVLHCPDDPASPPPA